MPSGSSARRGEAQRKAAQLLREHRARERRQRIVVWTVIGAAPIAAETAIAVVIVTSNTLTTAPSADSQGIPATPIRTSSGATGAPPWAAPANPDARVRAAGLTMLRTEGTVEHLHSHLTVTVNGRPETIPALIGVDESAQTISPLHTHDASGIVHVESPVKVAFTLGQLFTEWNVALDSTTVGSLGKATGDTITTFVNGKKVSGNPAAITLSDRADIDVVIAKSGTRVTPPTSFTWPAEY